MILLSMILPLLGAAQQRETPAWSKAGAGLFSAELSFQRSIKTLLCFAFLAGIIVSAQAAGLRSDESLILFPTFASRADDGQHWDLTVHGWIFEPEPRVATLAALQRALGIKDSDVTPDATVVFAERATPFLWDNERGKRVNLRIGNRHFLSDKSDANGHFTTRVQISAEEMEAPARTPSNYISRITMSAGLGEDRMPVTGEIFLLSPTGLSVISDIDDTIKISEVTDQRALLRNTFLKPFAPVPGMSSVYQAWATNNGAQFHYVSASPWQLYRPLTEFVRTNGFPSGTFHMKSFRWKDRSFFQLLASPVAYKAGVIEPLLKKFPQRRFVLVGDSGEKDPEIYGSLARKYPKQIARILIRNVTNEGAGGERYRTAFEKLPRLVWTVFRDSSELPDVP